jgi:hypothetical protein
MRATTFAMACAALVCLSCSSDNSSADEADAPQSVADAGSSTGSSNPSTGGGTSTGSGTTNTATGSTGSAAGSDAGTTASSDASAAAGTDAATTTDAGSAETSLTGTLGALGAVQPVVSSLVIANSGETIIYMSTSKIACSDLAESRWLLKLPAGSQVVEIVIKGAPKLQKYAVPSAEVNYAPGGKSSSYEKNAASGSITFTEGAANAAVSGTVTATYNSPAGSVSGDFHAEFCAGGQEY